MPPASNTPQTVTRIANELRRRSIQPPSREAILKVLHRTQDWGLAVDALTMWPRPYWVVDLAGKHPMPNRELLHPDDRADVDTWGHASTGQEDEA